MSQIQFPCPECNSQETIIEDFILVCSDCGNVINDVPSSVDQSKNIKNSRDVQVDCQPNIAPVMHEHVKKYCCNYGSKCQKNKRSSAPVMFGIKLISTLCKNLNITKAIREMSISLFRNASANKEFKFSSNNAKQSLALCCLYLTSNQENKPITISELANNADCTFNNIGTILLRLQKIHPEIFEHNSRNAESLVPLYTFKHDFNEKEKILISDYATSLVWMWREAVLIQGFNPINVIHAALFYAWKAVDRNRASASLGEFCYKFKIEKKRILKSKVDFYYTVLKVFVKCCPLLSDGEEILISKNTISLKIGQIVSMKRIILFNYNQMNNQKLDSEKRSMESTSKNENGNETNKKITAGKSSYDDDQEFSDSEIDSYIRTEDEVQKIKKLENLFEVKND